jgi:hypothetical protein
VGVGEMKKSEIVEHGIYANKRGWRRYVIAISTTGEYPLYEGQGELHTLQYKQLSGKESGKIANSTVTSFAVWAKEMVKE